MMPLTVRFSAEIGATEKVSVTGQRCLWKHPGGRLLPLLPVVSLLLAAWTAQATEGILLLGDDPVRVGRGGAAVAGAGDASWVTFNPAGLEGLDRRVEFGTSIIHSRATLDTNGIAEIPFSERMTDDEWNGFPGVGVVLPGECGTFGLSLHIPTGAMVHFPQPRSWVGLFEGLNDRNLEFFQPRLTLGYARRLDSGWVLGLSVNGSISAARTDQVTPRLLASRGDFKWDTALGAGFGLGLLRHWDRWSFGAALTSRQWSEGFDRYRDITPHTVDMPPTFQTGVGFKITPKVEIEIDYRFINWSDVRFFHEPSSGAGLGWNNQHGIMASVEWTANPRWTFRAGYGHLTSAMNDDHLFGSTLVPSVANDHIGAGFTRVLGERSEISLALAHLFKGSQSASGNGDIYAHLGRGSKSTLQADWLSLNYTLRF